MWQRRPGEAAWDLVEQPGAGDIALSVSDYMKQQDAHTATTVAQRHGLMMRQVAGKVAKVAADVQKHAKHLATQVAKFKADPSRGASKVRP